MFAFQLPLTFVPVTLNGVVFVSTMKRTCSTSVLTSITDILNATSPILALVPFAGFKRVIFGATVSTVKLRAEVFPVLPLPSVQLTVVTYVPSSIASETVSIVFVLFAVASLLTFH